MVSALVATQQGLTRPPSEPQVHKTADIEEHIRQPDAKASQDDLAKWLIHTTQAYYEASDWLVSQNQHVAEDCICETDVNGKVYTWQDKTIAGVCPMRAKYPEWQHIVHEITPQVYREAGYAHVYVYHSVIGCPVGVTTQHFGVWEWRFRDGKWMIVKYKTFGAPPLGDGADGVGCSGITEHLCS